MKVKLSQAVKMFFGNSSLEMIFFEAVANALDAEADAIEINISMAAFNKPETLKIDIKDNGQGFTDDRYKKFSHLFDVDESSHKGLGRLVYLCYFDDVKISSFFDKNKHREFDFSEGFDEEKFKVKTVDETASGSIFKMSGYTLQRIAKNEYLNPNYLKDRLLEEFYSRFFQMKKSKRKLSIKIKANIDGHQIKDAIRISDIPTFKTLELDSSINLFDKFHLHYSIEKIDPLESSLIAAISVDNRTVKVDIVAKENIPQGHKMVFLLFSDFFNGKVDPSRQNLTISKQELKSIQEIFRKKVATLIENKIPKIKERNLETKSGLVNRFPHLTGYFDSDNIGYVSRNDVLKKAQDDFFKAQRDILDANNLDEEQFEKSLELSSRALTEYILFRQITIDNLKNSTKKESEAELHKLFASMGKDGKFEKENAVEDLYRNNAWLLDDKYMTYETVLSDREMSDLVEFITDEEVEKDGNRPDIALVFSNDPNNKKPFDVVIVELKKRGISLEENMKAITQLEKRARKLMKYYNNQIQRIWYYGIIEFNEEVELALSGQYTELYSSGKMYYAELPVAISLEPKTILPIGIFMWDIDAVVSDANSRNSAFLNLIKSKFNKQ